MKLDIKSRAEKFLNTLVSTIRKMYSGKVTIILFGGRARGTSSDSGDFDIIVVLENVKDPIEEAIKIRRMLPKKRFPLDIVVIEKEDLMKPIVKKMLEHHKILYDGLKTGKLTET